MQKIFSILKEPNSDKVAISRIFNEIQNCGLLLNDPRLSKTMNLITEYTNKDEANNYLDFDTFQNFMASSLTLFHQVIEHNFVIPQWTKFKRDVTNIFASCADATEEDGFEGEVSKYLPQLSRVDPNVWAGSLCSVDGQRMSLGDGGQMKFTMQASQYPLAYSLALHQTSVDYVHSFVGQEPSGLPYMALALNDEKKPHNPMINAGSIVIASLLLQQASLADSFDHVIQHYQKMAGGEYIGFNNGVFLTEREVSHRNFAIGHLLKENHCLAADTNLKDVMDFYFQMCSIEADCTAGSIIAATLANGGICPITNERLLNAEAVRHTLSLMHSCGMYDFSGEFAFKVGLPAKSSISGVILIVVPNVMGICVYSPKLNRMNNSLKGVVFCEKLVSHFNFHNYDSLIHIQQKEDPRRRPYEPKAHSVVSLLFSAFNNDVTALNRVLMRGVNMETADYDKRTALHIACAEGHLDVVRFLLEVAKVSPEPVDRWGNTPLEEAKNFGKVAIVNYMRKFLGKSES